MPTWLAVFLGALVTALATGLGTIPFAFVRDLSQKTVARANALAAGLMLGASFGLIVEGAQAGTQWQTLLGALAGVAFILATQRVLGDHDVDIGAFKGATARRMLLIVVVMTVHSFSEGVAVGVSFAGAGALAAAITTAIAVHNIPEGLAISAVLRSGGASLKQCALWSIFSSLPQPLMAVPSYLFVERFAAALPYGLGFAAGAMVFMVLIELLPEAYEQEAGGPIAATTTAAMIAMLLFQVAIR